MSFKPKFVGFIITFFIFSCLWQTKFECWAQNANTPPSVSRNYKQLVQLSNKAIEQGSDADAASYLELAWQLKPQKQEYAYQAALLYFNARDYRKSVELFRAVVNNKKFPKVHLEYAQALQQAGEWDEAIPEFLMYLNNYNGKNREQVSEKTEEYVNGCSLAIRQLDSAKTANILVEHLNENINTQENDIAPVPFNDDLLYFTSRLNATERILRTQQTGTEWSVAEPLKNLPILPSTSFGNGTFSPDGTRFYCTICQELAKKKGRWCGIFVLKRKNEGWSEPMKLSQQINSDIINGANISTQPFVIFKGNTEVLFFTSNRKGGHGGMDIWTSSRIRTDENSDFSEPTNLGSIINTEGDEVTPFYDEEEQSLYFASNGRATMGGLDIFKSNGYAQRWTSPQNIGSPFNSGADDWYFIKNKSKTGGFFVSNRPFGVEKISSRDDDIFSFTHIDSRELFVSGHVFEEKTKSLLENVRLSLYEQRVGNAKSLRLLSSVMCVAGEYQFTILPNKNYTLEVEKDGFRVANASLSTKDSVKNKVRDFFLERYSSFVSNRILTPEREVENKKPVTEIEKDNSISEQQSNSTPSVTPEKSTAVREESNTNNTKKKEETAPKIKNPVETKPKEKIQFKVQFLAYETDLDNVNVKKLQRIDDLGDLETENTTVNGKRFTRVMIAYSTYEAAAAAAQKAKDRSLNDAFVIRYENGKRTNKSR